ncbi:protein FAM177A1 [Archocentrus centrarchus]|uniref:protein FAM177A1 n=1 Tax=Archocentrus centrarchus TaxID=63155 RepID=UPI0011E9F569|nr:protein FAM177B [Archocentrus centrarchus]
MSNQETSADILETNFGGPASSKEKKVIHFSSGETLEVEDSEEEEEQPSNRTPFEEPQQKTRLSFKNVAILVGRFSLLACDFLGERLAGAFGLSAAKYQYAIDRYHRDHKTTSSRAADGAMGGQAEPGNLSPGCDGSRYGATGDVSCSTDPQESCDEKRMARKEGCHNKGYQADEHHLK